jgi:hypothetical protein
MVRTSACLALAVSLSAGAAAGALADPGTALLERDGFQAFAAGQTQAGGRLFANFAVNLEAPAP